MGETRTWAAFWHVVGDLSPTEPGNRGQQMWDGKGDRLVILLRVRYLIIGTSRRIFETTALRARERACFRAADTWLVRSLMRCSSTRCQ